MNVIIHRYHWIALKIGALKELCNKEIILVSLKLWSKISKKLVEYVFIGASNWSGFDGKRQIRSFCRGFWTTGLVSCPEKVEKTGFRINLKQDRLRPVLWTVWNGFISFNWFHNLILNFMLHPLNDFQNLTFTQILHEV